MTNLDSSTHLSSILQFLKQSSSATQSKPWLTLFLKMGKELNMKRIKRRFDMNENTFGVMVTLITKLTHLKDELLFQGNQFLICI